MTRLLFSDVLHFSRSSHELRLAGGRGTEHIGKLLTQLEVDLFESKGVGGDPMSLSTALAVDVDKLADSIPEVAGLVDPADLIDDPVKLHQYLNPDQLLIDSDGTPPPRGCYMVNAADEPKMRQLMMDSGMAEAIPF